MYTKLRYLFFSLLLTGTAFSCQSNKHFDVVVVGGGTSGTCAAVQSARMGVNTLLIENSTWLGGMLTSAGVSAVDGDYNLPSGLWGEFRAALAAHYGSLSSLKTGWVSNVEFEPSVGNDIFQQWVKSQKTLTCDFNTSVEKLFRQKNGWKIVLKKKNKCKVVKASYLIDATELGDIAKSAGLSYAVGMDAASQTRESQAPAESNRIIQDMTYVITLKQYDSPHLIDKPVGYDPKEFCNCCVNRYNIDSLSSQKLWSKEMMLSYGKLPNHKYMINWPMYGNDIYLNDIEYTPAQRDSLHLIAKAKSIRFLYFMQHELGMTHLGLADDEYPTADKLPFIPYYREGRRFRGVVFFTINDILHPYDQVFPLYRTAIAVGDYPVDQHHNQYKGLDLPSLHFPQIPSYGVPLGVIIPAKEDRLLLAEKSISVTNIVNGTTRLQPVSMQIGQTAGVLAGLAVKRKCIPRRVPVHEVQKTLLDAGEYLLPFLDVSPNDVTFKSLQRIGVMGILHGKGKSIDWSNQTWLRADTLLQYRELGGLTSVYPEFKVISGKNGGVTLKTITNIISFIAKHEKIELPEDINAEVYRIFHTFKLGNPFDAMYITRKQMAVLIDQTLHPFENKNVDIEGNIIY